MARFQVWDLSIPSERLLLSFQKIIKPTIRTLVTEPTLVSNQTLPLNSLQQKYMHIEYSSHRIPHLEATLESVLPAVISADSSCSLWRMVRRMLSEEEPKIIVVELAP